MSSVRLDRVSKLYPEGGGVRDFSVEIADGEFFAFLGQSGCGKTTTLRVIAGLERPDSGRVYLDGRDVTDLPPEKRDAAMVFQNYALFPHLNVRENVAFGLKARKTPREETRRRVIEALELVQLAGLERRAVTDLSGGQQQRVALARAIAVQPKILLLDEPLSNLDAELRYSTRRQLADLQQRLKITAIYVTHDQEEALELAHRIAIMREGVVEQIGTPNEVLDHPATPFVESFLSRQRRLLRP
jgi:ABC-type Fe3+/spermidine/putrescine transport system ATPase subunit